MPYTVKDNPNPKKFISWGAGLQSTCLGVMVILGMLPKVDGIIFADPGWEHPYTYKTVDFYTKYFTENGLLVDIVSVGTSIKDFNWVNSPPFFYTTGAPITRQCTSYYKIQPIRQAMRRLCGLSASNTGRTLKKSAYCYMGISYDEAQRMRDSDRNWIAYEYPLVDMKWTRKTCTKLFVDNNLPIPMKSSCMVCPYHKKKEWALIKNTYPEEWDELIKFDEKIRDASPRMRARHTNAHCYLWKGTIPLKDVDFSEIDTDKEIEDICDAGYCFI